MNDAYGYLHFREPLAVAEEIRKRALLPNDQRVDVDQLCRAYGATYRVIEPGEKMN